MKNIMKAIAVTALAFLTGCASIISGGTQSVSFNSTPPGAMIVIDGANRGTTPATLVLERENNYAVTISLDGYETQSVNITRGINGWVWGNILLGGLIGLVVDAATGAMYKLTPEQVSTVMAQQVAVNGSNDALIIGFVMNADPNWQKVGQLQMN